MAARHEAVDDVGAGIVNLFAFCSVGVVGLLSVVGSTRHVGEDHVRVALQLGKMADRFGVLKLVKRTIDLAAAIGRFVRQSGECFDHLASEIQTQRVAFFDDVRFEFAQHRSRRRAVGQDVCRRLGRENPAIEISRQRAVMRAELHLVGYHGAYGIGCKLPGVPVIGTILYLYVPPRWA